MNNFNYHKWLLNRKEFYSILGKNYKDWYLTNNNIEKILLLYTNNNLSFFPTQNGKVPKKIPVWLILYIVNFEKYKVKYFLQRLNRLFKMSPNELKANSKYNYFLKYGKEIGISLFNDKNKRSTISYENFIKKYGMEEGTKRYNEWCNVHKGGLSRFQLKYGIEEGTKRYNEWCRRNGGNYSLERLISLYGMEEGTKRYNETQQKVKSFGTLKYFIDKYGDEEGTKRYNDKINKLHFGASLEGFIKKYGKINGPKLFKESKDNCSLKSFIKKYGEEIGTQKYNDFIYKMDKKAGSCISKISLKYFDTLSNYLLEKTNLKENDIFYGRNGKRGEFYLKYYKDNIPKSYFYDFTILSKKIIIEFNGNYYHAKKSLSKEEKEIWANKRFKNANESIKHDEHKELIAKLNRI